MVVSVITAGYDPLLRPLLEADSAAAREREIERIIVAITQPLTERIVSRFARTEGMIARADAEDIIATVNLRVLRKLQAQSRSDEEAVQQFTDYVATLTYNAIHDHLRRSYPARTRLANRLRYLLSHDERLALWPGARGLTAGLAPWKGRDDVLPDAPPPRAAATRAMLDTSRPADALVEIVRHAGRPLLFTALMARVIELWEIEEAPAVPLESVPLRASAAHARDVETRDLLRALWREILLLPPPQRKALLLNLRDSETVNVISLLALTSTAKLAEIAAAMEMTPDALARIWNDLPLDDLTIARLLGLTRQQVINLRKSARERLARRLRFPKGRPSS